MSKKEVNLRRLSKALQRAGYSVLKKVKKIPQNEEGYEELRKAFVEIADHAEKLGWLKRPKPKIKLLKDDRTEEEKRQRVAPTIQIEWYCVDELGHEMVTYGCVVGFGAEKAKRLMRCTRCGIETVDE